MCNRDNLSAHIVVESVDAICVDETVTDPAAGPYGLLNLAHHLEMHAHWNNNVPWGMW